MIKGASRHIGFHLRYPLHPCVSAPLRETRITSPLPFVRPMPSPVHLWWPSAQGRGARLANLFASRSGEGNLWASDLLPTAPLHQRGKRSAMGFTQRAQRGQKGAKNCLSSGAQRQSVHWRCLMLAKRKKEKKEKWRQPLLPSFLLPFRESKSHKLSEWRFAPHGDATLDILRASAKLCASARNNATNRDCSWFLSARSTG